MTPGAIACTACGAESIADSRFCSRCGAPLQAPVNGSIAETIAVPETAMRAITPPRISAPRISSTSSADEGRFVSGTLLAGRYRIIGLLGRGGMGEVYRATDLTLAQSVALKFLPEAAASDQRFLERFHNEVRVARQVSHPNVCRVYDIGEADGAPFLSMEYVDGEDLASLLQRIGRLPSDKALEIARKVCAGLAAAHAKGVIHRDLKPQNIMLDRRGEVLILDFGLAAVADQLQGPEAKHGTPAYMSPEQLRGADVTAKSDVYALGLVLYELFTGKRAYEAKSVAELLQLQETARPTSMTTLAADVDPGVERVILRCLQPDPAQRPANPLSVAAALPGGDPLAAALAAGETPSPEVVAAAGSCECLPLRYTVPCLVAILLGLAVLPFVTQRTLLLFQTPMDYPPSVLENKARELAASFGYSARPKDWESDWQYHRGYLTFLEKQGGSKDWPLLFQQESPILFPYRESPRYLESPPDGDVTADRPPHIISGMVHLELDSRGRLRMFSGVPPQRDENPPAAPLIEPRAVFQAIGFDLGQFEETTPQYTPPTAFDSRRAWKGKHPELPDLPVSVEISGWRGKITDVKLVWPWTKPTRMVEEETAPSQAGFALYRLLLFSAGLVAVALLARRNLRLGRGDRQGAFRLAAAFFFLAAFIWLTGLHLIPSFRMSDYFLTNAGLWLFHGALMWMLYIALEPAVRARWPQSIITWSRVLAGRFRDARVGADILFGMTLGMVFVYMFFMRYYVMLMQGRPPGVSNLEMLLGIRFLLNNVADRVFDAVQSGLMIIFVLFGLRSLLRRDYLAAIAAAILGTFIESGIRQSQNLVVDLPVYLLIWTALTFAMLRLGLIPTIVSMFTINMSLSIPLSLQFSAWYNSAGLLMMLMLVGLAAYGFWCSQRKTPAASSA